jgi:hypothetical protein
MFARSAFLALAAFVPLVAAHGALKFAVVDGTRYDAPNPNGDSGQFTIRAINDINPVKGTSNPDMNCGHNAQKAALVADANPGSVVGFAWANGEGGTWVHNTGPVMTYMASCGDAGCANFDSANAQFFKIAEQGKKADGTWTMAELNAGPDATTSITLPADLPAGEYLIRHELIAMQLGMSQGGAEFYPACFQVRLASPSRTAAALPSGDQVVTFPGGYGDSDPGILDPNIYNPGNDYVFPGPAVISSVVADPSADPSTPANTSSTTTPTETNPSSSQPAPTSGNGCGNPNRKVKRVVKRIVRQGPLIKKRSKASLPKREPVQAHKKRAEHIPIRNSRVMRGVQF